MSSDPKANKSARVVPDPESSGVPPARREFLRSTFVGAIAGALVPDSFGATRAEPPSFELNEVTISQLQQGLQAGAYTARSLTEKYLARIDAVDKSGPAINSVIEVNPDALAVADALDKERQEKGPRGPLHGIPVLVKDNIDTSDRMMTTAGSLALVGAKPAKDAFLIQRLRQAGVVILGKTNPSEWANIRSGHSSSGWSARGGLTRNPYALDRNPCGSSSGSGAAVSANLCAGAIGTETDGSIVCPSSANGVVGIKPSVGLVSRSGVIPISHTQDTAGPMCRTVRDAAILLGAMAGIDPNDGATSASNGHALADYTAFCDPNGLRGARLGVVRKYFGFSDPVDALMVSVLELLKKQGATLADPAEIDSMGKFGDFEFTVLLYEFKAGLNAYLARPGSNAPVHTLKEIIDFNDRNRELEMPYFGQDTFIKAQAKGPLSEKEYVEALEKCGRLTRKEGIDAVMDKLKLDAFVAPTGGPAWITDLLNGDNGAGGSSSLAAVAGYPSITVPAGFIFGLPVGLSFFGRAWSEPTLIKLAYSFEQASNVRKAPSFLPSVGLKP